MTTEERERLNLSLNGVVKRLMKSQCALDNEDVSDVTERLYRKFLESKGVRIKETPKSRRGK